MISRPDARLSNVRYGNNIAKLAVGTGVAQALAISASPVLTRIFSPNDFGVFAVYASIVGIIGSLASLSYHQAIPLPEDRGEAANLFGLSLLLLIVTASLISIAGMLVGSDLAAQLGVPELAAYLWLIPLGVLGLGFYEVTNQWAIRQKVFSVVARTTAAKGLVQTGTHLSIGFLAIGPIGLLLGQLFGQWLGAGSLLRSAIRESSAVFRGITLSGMKEAALRYAKFFRFTSPAILFNVAGTNAPAIILSYYFGSAVAGFLALGERVLAIPVTLLAKSASQVFVASAAEFHREGRLGIEVEYLFERMLKLSFAPVVILGISAPVMFSVIFGDQWAEAGHYVRWLSAWLLFVFISLAIAPVVIVLERQRVGMWFQGVLAFVRIGSLIVGGLIGDALLAVALFGVVSGLLWAIYLAWLLVVSGVSIISAAKISSKALLVSMPFVTPVAVCAFLGVAELIAVGVAVICIASATAWQLIGKNQIEFSD